MSESAQSQRPALDRSADPAYHLWQLWRQGQRPDVREFLAAHPELSLTRCVAVLRVDQHERWQAGERVTAEDYLQSCFVLHGSDEHALDVVLSEFLLRERLGESPDLEEYTRRFPQFAEQLRLQVELHCALGLSRAGDSSAEERAAFEDWQTVPRVLGTARAAGTALVSVPGYEILDTLGKGGMGVVYQARHLQLRRLVALKMLRGDHTAGDELLARFRAESAALARLQHPNIVQVYEVGEHDGRPFFALEYVAGGSLARKAAGTPQPAREAAHLLQALARAVHYAHERGIVHRDLKPQNVLLAEDGTPKVADFGLAKLLAVEAGDSSLDYQTRSGAILGTPCYMAPEQTGGKGVQVGRTADVYALGAILYELLTGRPPHQGAAVLETLEQVRSQEPVPPSRLQPKVPRDLETICLRCLRKEPAKRYGCAAALADDLERFLNGRPIQARPVSRRERCWKWARRRPGVATLAVALSLALLSLLGLGIWSYVEISAALERAEAERTEALRAGAEETRQKQEAERRGEEARRERKRAWAAADDFFTKVTQYELLHQPEMDDLRKALLKKAVTFYKQLIQESGGDPDLQAELGRAYIRYGHIIARTEATAKGTEYYQQGLQILKRLAEGKGADNECLSQLAEAYRELGGHYFEMHRLPEAEASYLAAVNLLRRLPERGPKAAEEQKLLGWVHQDLGLVYHMRGQLREAEKELQIAIATHTKLWKTEQDNAIYRSVCAGSHEALARVHHTAGRLAEAEKQCRLATTMNRTLMREAPLAMRYRLDLGIALLTQSEVYQSQLRLDEAEKSCNEVRQIFEPLARAHPSVSTYQRLLGLACQGLGAIYSDQRKLKEAVTCYLMGGEIFSKLELPNPQVPEYPIQVAGSCIGLARLMVETRQHKEALQWIERGRAKAEPLIKQGNQSLRARRVLWMGDYLKAQALDGLGRSTEALLACEKALQLAEPPFRGIIELYRAQLWGRSGDHARAAAALKAMTDRKSGVSARLLYTAGTVYAVCAQTTPQGALSATEEVRERYATEAVRLIAEAHALGLFARPVMLGDLKASRDLDTLRTRPDFRQLLARIERELKSGR